MSGKETRNNASGEKGSGKENIEPKITEGYVADTELENLLKKDFVNIDAKPGEDSESDTPDLDKNNKKDAGQISMNGETKNLLGRAVQRLKNAWNSYVDISGKNFLIPIFFMIGTVIYLELVFHLLIYRSIDDKIIYPVLFSIPFGLLIGFITGLFNRIINKILLWVITAVICLVFNVQLIYNYIFKVYFSFQTIGMAGDAVTEFWKQILTAVKANLLGVILLFLPFIVLILLISSLISYNRRGLREQAVLIGSAAVFHVVALIALLVFGKGNYSPYDLYHNSKVPDMLGRELGITTLTRIDLERLFSKNEDFVLADTIDLPDQTKAPTKVPTPAAVTGSQEETSGDGSTGPTQPPTPTPIDTSPNIMNIDFNALAANETDDTFRKLDQYFASVTPTNKNAYTGMFKGYNLIQITAEGFSPYAVNEQTSPTLYKLVHEGFVFNNFYTALWQTSTSDGEYVNLLGIIPTGSRNMYNGRNNLWPFALGNQFDQLGVQSRAYHDHTYTYYERDQTHPNLGYLYEGVGNGLILEHPDIWPESDLEMINATVDDYIHDDRFHVYYLTVSGHMNYSFTGNMMSYKNREAVADLPYSEDGKAYIACQIELDKALEQLIKKLEEAGVADHTVIALNADHYPYGWEKYKYDELAGHEIEPYFELYRNNFILWSEGMKENVIIDEPCSSMDVLPTLSNLFGLEYDSRLLMGRDVFSGAPPLVILANRSFITDKVMYNTETGEVTNLTGEALPDGYVDNMINIVKNKFTVSTSILKLDYYRHIFSNYPSDFE